nr:DNA cytosine methyltransferase [Prosthecomicrobium hirschii]
MQAVAYGGNDTRGPIEVATALNAHGVPHGRLDFESETFVAAPVGFNGRQDPDVTGDRAGSVNTSSPQDQCVMTASAVRRLTPLEAERLQGFPDGYTAIPYRGKPAADGPRYKALGNSMAVNVMRWIGRRIEMFERVRGAA